MDKQTQAVATAIALAGNLPFSEHESDTQELIIAEAKAAIAASGAEHLGELVSALEPFAYFIEQFKRQPLRGQDDIYVSIHLDSEFEAKLRLSDMEKASEALSKLPPELRGE